VRGLQAIPLRRGRELSEPEPIAVRLARVEARIDAACRRAGRPRSTVRLVGASKFQPVEAMRAALRLFRVFHAIDRAKIATTLDDEAARAGLLVSGFLEVNLGGEATKHGFSPEELAGAVAPLADLRHLRIVGLMTIPPPARDPEEARPWFRRLAALRDLIAPSCGWANGAGRLSMGMSDDFEVAIEEGATEVRVGTALFGPRPAAAPDARAGEGSAGVLP